MDPKKVLALFEKFERLRNTNQAGITVSLTDETSLTRQEKLDLERLLVRAFAEMHHSLRETVEVKGMLDRAEAFSGF
jgi:hypothetical protein